MPTVIDQSPPMPVRILLIKLSALGDVTQTLPTLEAIRAIYPQAEITWLVEEAAAPILADHPALDTLLISRRRSWLAAWRSSGSLKVTWREFRQMVQTLRQRPYDLVIDLQGLLKSAFWTSLARSPRKIGFDRTREYSYLALTERLPPYDPDEHAVRRYLRVAQHLGAAGEPVRFRLALPVGAGKDLEYLWTEKTGPLIIMHPGTRWATKHWPPESFASLADALTRERQARVVFTGSPADRPLIARIRSRMQTPAEDLSGRTDLKALARLFYQADVAVTTDTGPMHLAAAVGTPVVAVFGPTAPWRTGPFGRQHRVLRTALPCSPCFQRRCPTPDCLTDLGVADVLSAVREILDQGLSRSKPLLIRQVIQSQAFDIIDHVA
jgi:heptosyltransferase I